MDSTYLLFKFLHVATASVWIGAVVTVTVLNARLASESDLRMIGAIAQHSQRLGKLLIGPFAGLTLITGGVTMAVSGIGFAGWIIWGITAMVLSGALGGTVARRSVEALIARVATAEHVDASIAAQQRRLAVAEAIMILLLLSAVWAMVFKPTF